MALPVYKIKNGTTTVQAITYHDACALIAIIINLYLPS